VRRSLMSAGLALALLLAGCADAERAVEDPFAMAQSAESAAPSAAAPAVASSTAARDLALTVQNDTPALQRFVLIEQAGSGPAVVVADQTAPAQSKARFDWKGGTAAYFVMISQAKTGETVTDLTNAATLDFGDRTALDATLHADNSWTISTN
jgi:hypothetical protein